MNPPPLGASIADLDTPALCLDLDAMDHNIRTVAAECKAAGVAWRPHAKGHKNTWIAQQQIAAGAIGVTCAKLGEAEVMAAAGIRDLLIANLVVGPLKVARLVELRKIADPIVCLDDMLQAIPISQAMAAAGLRVRAMIEVDIGLNRVGVAPGEATLTLARQLQDLPGIELAGIMGYEGHALTIPDPVQKTAGVGQALGLLQSTKQLLTANGIECPLVSCGGTGSYQYSIKCPGITEVQAGGAIFMDVFYRQQCGVHNLQDALTVLTTVVSRPVASRAIIDAGRKTLNIEVQTPRVRGRDDLTIKSLSAEHGTLELAAAALPLNIGDRLELVPGYADLTCMLHDQYFAFRNGKLERILKLETRGIVQ